MTVKIVSIDIENSSFIEQKLGGDLTRMPPLTQKIRVLKIFNVDVDKNISTGSYVIRRCDLSIVPFKKKDIALRLYMYV